MQYGNFCPEFLVLRAIPICNETRSLPTLTRSYPRRFAFYVAIPTPSILESSICNSAQQLLGEAGVLFPSQDALLTPS
ncbi:MAG: hypothetical protein QOE26_391 [Verrucomicrobiota bacterium]|jgi:hypothetical protein